MISTAFSRTAIGTVAALALLPFAALGVLPGSTRLLDRLASLSTSGVAAAMLVVMLALATIALARYLVLSALGPLLAPRAEKHP